MHRTRAAAGCGVLAAAAGVAVAELLAAAFRPGGSPIIAVGGAIVDAVPTPLKEWAVRTVGTADKPLLLAGVGLALAGLAAITGIAAARRRRLAVVGAAVLGLVGVAAVLGRPTTGPVAALPTLVGAVVAAVVLRRLLSQWQDRLSPADPTPAGPTPAEPALATPAATDQAATDQATGAAAAPGPTPGGTSRRRLLVTTGLVVAGSAAAGGQAVALRLGGARSIARARAEVRLPEPADPAPPLPDGTADGFYTPNDRFYRIDTALAVPRVDPASWELVVRGMVDRPLRIGFDELLRMPLVERDVTLNCVSGEVGGPYVGTARWLGVPLDQVLRRAGVSADADQLVARSVEGMTIGTPVATVLDGRDAMLAVGMNGAPLPTEHGFPVRVLTPGLYGYTGSCKWLSALELTTFDAFDAYWVRRGWAPRARVKTSSRIDRPRPNTTVRPGGATGDTVTVAGVAWAQRRGIDHVQLSVDGEDWQPAQLLPAPSPDTWVQWRYRWRATPGQHTLRVRAVDGHGDVQTGERTDPFPDGATGWHTVRVTVA